MTPSNGTKFSEENHTLLVQLRDNVGSLGGTLDNFIKAQSEENRRLHGRIDDTNSAMLTAVGSIKDTIAERSRVTPALIAMILSSLAIIGGAGSYFVNLQASTLRTDIDNIGGKVAAAEIQRLTMADRLSRVEVESATKDATSIENRRWIEKLQDEIRTDLIRKHDAK